MSQTVFEKSIRSRPVYGVLQPRAGTAHLCVADGEGAGAIRDLFAKAGGEAALEKLKLKVRAARTM